MYRRIHLVAILMILAGLSGCVNPPLKDVTFLSADPDNGGLRGYESPTTDSAEGDNGGGEERTQIEPDVIRQADNLLFILNQYRGLSIVDLDSEELLSQSATSGYPRDLYLVGDRAYVLVSYAGDVTVEDDVETFTLSSRLYVLNVADPAHVSILSSFDLAGDLVDSRIVGDVLYAVSAQYQYAFYANQLVKQQVSASWVTSVNIANPNDIHVVDELDFDGYGSVIHTTPSAMFVSAHDYQTDNSRITYIDISDPAGAIQVRGNVAVPGNVSDRFKMDAWNGVLRVVSATGWPNRQTLVTTYDLANPDKIALLGQAVVAGTENETLFATRFDGPKAYLVTYLIVDPLFVVDLSDPANPAVTGVLEVPGWSTHIQPMGDRLVALGVDDSDGRKVSVSLFDVADPAAPALLDRASFGENWSWSSAFNDVKSFTVLEDTLIVPFSGWSEEGGFDRLQFLTYDDNTLSVRDFVDLDGEIVRSFAHAGNYYGVTTEQLAIIDGADLDNLETTNTVTLAEYLDDIHELSPDVRVEVITRFDKQTTLLRATSANGVALGEAEVPVSNLVQSLRWNSTVLLVNVNWEDSAALKITPVDFSVPAAPKVLPTLSVPLQPYYWGIYRGGPEVDIAVAGRPAGGFWYPWWIPQESAFVAGDTLAVHGYAEKYARVVGAGEVNSGLGLVDLNAMKVLPTVGLGLDQVEVIDAVDGRLYIGSKLYGGTDVLGRGFSAHYASAFNPANGTLESTVNVPGLYLQYDPASDLLVLEDLQYTSNFDTTRSLRTVQWDGDDSVTPLGKYDLRDPYGQVYGGGDRIYVEGYNGGYSISSVNVAGNGAMSEGNTLTFKNLWASFIDSDGPVAYISLNGQALGRYDFGNDAALIDLTQTGNTPQRIRFGANTAYLTNGYAGLVTLAR